MCTILLISLLPLRCSHRTDCVVWCGNPNFSYLSFVLWIRVIIGQLSWKTEVWYFARQVLANKNVTSSQILNQERKKTHRSQLNDHSKTTLRAFFKIKKVTTYKSIPTYTVYKIHLWKINHPTSHASCHSKQLNSCQLAFASLWMERNVTWLITNQDNNPMQGEPRQSRILNSRSKDYRFIFSQFLILTQRITEYHSKNSGFPLGVFRTPDQ